jgi:hypothetical protein
MLGQWGIPVRRIQTRSAMTAICHSVNAPLTMRRSTMVNL